MECKFFVNKMLKTKPINRLWLTIFCIMVLCLAPVSALSVDIPVSTNYSEVNTNHSLTSDYATASGYATNSGQLEGRDTATLVTYIQGLYDLVYCKLTGCTMSGNLIVNANATAQEFHFPGARWVNLSHNSDIDGSVAGLMMTNPPNPEVPHFWIQTGGSSQASGVARSFIIANEDISVLNNSNRTSCVAWADAFGTQLLIDCNTTTTGADLFVGDDMQVNGDVFIPSMSTTDSTYASVNDFFNIISSAGRISGGDLTNPSGTLIVVEAGTGMLRILDDDISQVKFIDWADSGSINVTTNSIMYFGVDYNGGSPIVYNTTTEAGFDLDTQFPLGQAINQDGEIYFISNPWWVGDGLTNIIERFGSFGHLSRDQEVGGLIIGYTGTRALTMTAGRVWGRLNEHEISSFDSSGADTFDMYYQDGAGNFNEIGGLSQWNNTDWDDGGVLTPIANNQYTVIWIWLNVASGKPSLIFPQMTYPSSAGAEAEEVPNTFPAYWSKGGILLGRMILKEGVDIPIQVDSAFGTVFTAAQAADHGNLGGLTDDDHLQYAIGDGTRTSSYGNFTTLTVSGNAYIGDLVWNGDLDLGGNKIFNVGDINASDIYFNDDLIYAPVPTTRFDFRDSALDIKLSASDGSLPMTFLTFMNFGSGVGGGMNVINPNFQDIDTLIAGDTGNLVYFDANGMFTDFYTSLEFSADDLGVKLGAGQDSHIYYNGSDTRLDNLVGNGDFKVNMNLDVQDNVTTTNIKLNEVAGACDLTTSGNICHNSSGVYIVG